MLERCGGVLDQFHRHEAVQAHLYTIAVSSLARSIYEDAHEYDFVSYKIFVICDQIIVN